MIKIILGAALVLLASFYLTTVSATPVIQEVYYDQPSTDGSEVFTEIYGTAGFDLTGWRLDAINGNNDSVYRSIDLSGALIPTDGVLLISISSANVLLKTITDFTANIDWQNGPDSVWLIDDLNNLVDSIQYGVTAYPTRGEGQPAPDVTAGFSLSRAFAGLDTNNNLADFIVSTPTPGTVNYPQAAALKVSSSTSLSFLIPGLIALLVSQRRHLRKADG